VEIKNKNSSPNAFSNWGIIKHSVKQGSILGRFYLCSFTKAFNFGACGLICININLY
jgi:hypothetical protein